MVVRLFITLAVFSLLFFPTFISSSIADDITSWCSQTPHPKPCEFFLRHNPKFSQPINQKSDFLKISLQLALDQAKYSKNNTYQLGPKCHNEREKAAWSDCLELYDSTVKRINKTIYPSKKCSQVDAQTWLSTALTNLQTCLAGFDDLGVSGSIFPSLLTNVSELISNSLAVNKGSSDNPNTTTSYKNGFPTWVSPGDRKLLQSSASSKANIVVAQDGSGNYKTVTEAISAAGKSSTGGRFVIYVKGGTYTENVKISLDNIMLVGDGIGKTIITGSKSVGGGSTTFNSATFAASGDNFIAQGITFRNTAGASNHQAVALRSNSDLSVFYLCSFEGYQDTLYTHSERQFYRECDIYGTVDFIFGNAAVVFQNCNIYPRYPPNKTNTITAQGRTNPNQNTGISIHNCKVTTASDLKSSQSLVKTYLGRPLGQYSRTVFMKTYLDSLIDPVGWLAWDGDFALSTLYYGEYKNTGSGSSTSNRVKWVGYHVITSSSEASKFTVGNFIAGNAWLPATGVPYTSGL